MIAVVYFISERDVEMLTDVGRLFYTVNMSLNLWKISNHSQVPAVVYFISERDVEMLTDVGRLFYTVNMGVNLLKISNNSQ